MDEQMRAALDRVAREAARLEERAAAAKWTGLRWHADLRGEDGNAWVIMGVTSKAIKSTHGAEEAKAYTERAMSGDYANLVAVTLEYIEIVDKPAGYLEVIE